MLLSHKFLPNCLTYVGFQVKRYPTLYVIYFCYDIIFFQSFVHHIVVMMGEYVSYKTTELYVSVLALTLVKITAIKYVVQMVTGTQATVSFTVMPVLKNVILGQIIQTVVSHEVRFWRIISYNICLIVFSNSL